MCVLLDARCYGFSSVIDPALKTAADTTNSSPYRRSSISAIYCTIWEAKTLITTSGEVGWIVKLNSTALGGNWGMGRPGSHRRGATAAKQHEAVARTCFTQTLLNKKEQLKEMLTRLGKEFQRTLISYYKSNDWRESVVDLANLLYRSVRGRRLHCSLLSQYIFRWLRVGQRNQLYLVGTCPLVCLLCPSNS